MKIVNYFLFALAAIGMFACSNDDDNSSGNEGPSSLSVSLSLGGNTLRTTAPVDSLTSDSINLKSILINITDGSGAVVATKTIVRDDVVNSDWYNLVTPNKGLKFINIPQTITSVYAYGNPGNAVTDNTISTNLAAQQGSNVLYYGTTSTLTPIQDEPIQPDPAQGKTYTANVTIAPIVARMQVNSISFQASGSTPFTRVIDNITESATVSWTGFSAKLRGIYFNNFYYTYNGPGSFADLLQNSTFQGNIQNGEWLFRNVDPALNATDYASYSNYTTAYQELPLRTSKKTYAFNFFPGTTIPSIHLDLSDLAITTLTSTNNAVFNPSLFGNERFANIVKFYKNGVTLMTPSDFTPGTIYNMDINVIPILDNDLGNIQYNILVHVTVAPWVEETIIPGFNINQ